MKQYDKDNGNLPEGFPDNWRVYAKDDKALANGEFYLSVTTVLSVVLDDGFKDWLLATNKPAFTKIMERSARAGTELHEEIQKVMKGETPDYSKYQQAILNYENLQIEHKIKATEIEPRVYHEDYGYAGSVDAVGTFGEDTCLFELKTGKYLITAGWQAAAYKKAYEKVNNKELDRMVGIHCHRDGSQAKVFKYRHVDTCFNAFLSALNVFRMNYFNKLMKLKWKWVTTEPIQAKDITNE